MNHAQILINHISVSQNADKSIEGHRFFEIIQPYLEDAAESDDDEDKPLMAAGVESLDLLIFLPMADGSVFLASFEHDKGYAMHAEETHSDGMRTFLAAVEHLLGENHRITRITRERADIFNPNKEK